MKKKEIIRIVYFACCLLFFVQGCKKRTEDLINNQEYNLLITNNTPLSLKSIVIEINHEKNNQNINALIDSNINTGGTAKFYIPDVGNCNFKIILNPKNNYSVSKKFTDSFSKSSIQEYEIIIQENEVIIQKIEQ